MTTREEHKPTKPLPDQRDGLALDPETIKDLEPKAPGDVRGGRSSGGGSIAGSIAGSNVT